MHGYVSRQNRLIVSDLTYCGLSFLEYKPYIGLRQIADFLIFMNKA